MESRSESSRWALAVLLAIAALPASALGQGNGDLDGSWVVRAAGDDELAFRVDISGDEARVEVFKSLSRWSILPDGEGLSAGESVLVRAHQSGPGRLNLELQDWRAQMVLQSPATAVIAAPPEARLGVAHRLIPLDPDLLGEWERAELTPAGPRIRRLSVEEGQVVLTDRLERSESVAASGVAAVAPVRAIALFPQNESGALVRLYPFDGGYLALEAEDDELQVIYRPGEAPPWLDLAPNDVELADGAGDRPTGRWLVGSGDRARQTHVLDFTTTPARLHRLGDDRADPVHLAVGSAAPLWLVVVELADGPELYHLLFVDGDRGVLFSADDNAYRALRRIVDTPIALSGEWRVERAVGDEAERVTLVGDTLRRPARNDRHLIYATTATEAPMALTIVEGGHRGHLLRLWSVEEGVFASDDGDRWVRPAAAVE